MGVNFNNVNANSGIKYDKNEIAEAMNKKTTAFYESENETGNFVEIIDTETKTSYTLADYDKDGKIDACRKEVRDDYNGESKIYDDIDFDGDFDRTIEVKNIGNGNTIQAFDNNADGEVDNYLYLKNEE